MNEEDAAESRRQQWTVMVVNISCSVWGYYSVPSIKQFFIKSRDVLRHLQTLHHAHAVEHARKQTQTLQVQVDAKHGRCNGLMGALSLVPVNSR